MKASIIIRAYNAEATLARAIDSTLHQNFPSDQYEVIIINDGSTDGTQTVARCFEKDKRVRVIFQENRGHIEAANRGFVESRGLYVTLLDSDDEFLPTLLSNLIAEFEKDPEIDFAYSDYKEEYNGMERDVHVKHLLETTGIGVIYRKNRLKKAGLWNNTLLFPEYDLILRTSGRWKSAYVPKPLFIYHRRTKSLTGDGTYEERGRAQLISLHPDKIDEISHIRSYAL